MQQRSPLSAPIVETVKKMIAKGAESGELITCWEEVQQVLKDAGLAWRQRTPPKFVAEHPENRSSCNDSKQCCLYLCFGFALCSLRCSDEIDPFIYCACRSKLGSTAIAAHYHGAKILKGGFSATKAMDVTAFEVLQDDIDMLAAANAQMVKLSKGLLPPLEAVRLVAIGGNHTNSFLRAVAAGCPTPVQELQGPGGVLHATTLAAGRPAFAEAIDQGLNWLVLDGRLLILHMYTCCASMPMLMCLWLYGCLIGALRTRHVLQHWHFNLFRCSYMHLFICCSRCACLL